jgi:HAD superfamily hydrolase (TIGR01509 family)
MDWIHHFQLFLFDFDGLLVDTESLHYQAYRDALAKRGFKLDWDFLQFCGAAHLDAEALKRELCSQFSSLSLDWVDFYKEKKTIYLELVSKGGVKLMPGVEALLKALEKANIRRCIVTNSFHEQILLISSQIPILQTIPKWITREVYNKPKPSSECYLKAIELYAEAGDKIVGFEDSIRGLEALKGTPALPILICSSLHPLLPVAQSSGVIHFESFEKLNLGILDFIKK